MNKVYKALHLFSGIGGGSLGFSLAQEEYRGVVGKIENLLGVDAVPEICQDYERITGGRAACMDLFSREQYMAFHGEEPPADWKEVTPEMLREAAGDYPDIVFTSPPCKGFSGLLGGDRAKLSKYQALNQLTIRSIRLTLEAFKSDLPALILLENVPRIKTRGKRLLDQIKQQLALYGYVLDEADHDCGVIGGLAQHRKRYLLIARNPEKLDSFVYKPPVRRVQSIGSVLESLPMPGSSPIHSLPKLQFKTWVRLALIPAGGDWRDLKDFPHEEYCINFAEGTHTTIYRVQRWEESSRTVTGAYRPNNGALSIADPRIGCTPRSGTYGVMRWDKPSKTVTSADIHAGTAAVADPRIPDDTEKGVFVVVAEDGTWHRPLTTLELAALQGFPATLADGAPFELSGTSDAKWRERVGNAVPVQAAAAIAETMLRSLLAQEKGEWLMSGEEVWVNENEENREEA